MSNVAQVIKAMRAERDRKRKELSRLDKAIQALRKIGGATSRSAPARGTKKRRKMSAAARRKIAEAQRARWAKINKQKKAV